MQIILSVIVGACVCLFGIWIFIKGQQSMAEIIANGKPENLKSPLSLIKSGLTAEQSKTEIVDIEQQLQAMFSDRIPTTQRG
jgi:lipopolysaccharide export LptBFGC system permease protein LptF